MPRLTLIDEPALPTAAENRERNQRARIEARSRYRVYLTEVLSERGVDNAGAVAEVAVDALTEWRSIETGEFCRCSCHPRLPDSDRH